MSDSADHSPGGPAAEARRLVEALGDWASVRLNAADEHLATASVECQLCPVCQLISALRGDRPEMMARLGDAWAAFLGVLTDHSPSGKETTGSGSAGSGMDASGPEASGSEGADPTDRPAPDSEWAVRSVQNIDVR